MSTPKKTEPISILKNSNSHNQPLSFSQSTRILLSDEEEDAKKYSDGENDEDDQQIEHMSAEALELLNTEKVLKSGYLLKKGELRRSWKKRWFVLRSTKLAMYKDNKEYKLLRIIDLHEIHKVVQVTTKHKYKYVFAFVTPKRMYYVQANDQKDMDDWFTLVNKAKEDQRLYEADDDTSSINRDHEFAKDVISSYNSNHAANMKRRHSNNGEDIKPIDIVQKKHQDNGDLSDYSVSRTYPMSPSFDEHEHRHAIEGVASSDDDEDYSADITHILSEESRNRVLIESYLLKLGRNKGWRKRWFVLRTDTLAYYEDDKEYSPHKIIPLANIIDSLEIGPISKSKQFCFKIIIPNRSYVVCAPTEEDMDAWLNALIVATNRAKKETGNSPAPSTPVPQPHSYGSGHMKLPFIPESEEFIHKTQSIDSNDSLENASHLSDVSGAGGVGGAGGALGGAPTPSVNLAHLHLRASERLGRAK